MNGLENHRLFDMIFEVGETRRDKIPARKYAIDFGVGTSRSYCNSISTPNSRLIERVRILIKMTTSRSCFMLQPRVCDYKLLECIWALPVVTEFESCKQVKLMLALAPRYLPAKPKHNLIRAAQHFEPRQLS